METRQSIKPAQAQTLVELVMALLLLVLLLGLINHKRVLHVFRRWRRLCPLGIQTNLSVEPFPRLVPADHKWCPNKLTSRFCCN